MFACPLLYFEPLLYFAFATFFVQDTIIVFVATGIASISHGSLTVFRLGVKGQVENYFLS